MLVMEAFGRRPGAGAVSARRWCWPAPRCAWPAATAQQAALLPQVAEGKLLLAFAHGERQARYDLPDVLTTATPKAAAGCSTAPRASCSHGDSADKLVVSARTAGDRDDTAGITLFLVDGDANGVARRGYTLRDGTRAAEIALSGVEVGADAVLGEVGAALSGRRARRRGRHRRHRRRGGRRDGDDAGDDARIPQDAPAIRPADRRATRPCSTAPPRCSWRWSRGAAWPCWRR